MTTITNAQVITVLKHLAAGRQPDFAAQVTHLPPRVVEDIAEKHGWPDPEAVRKGIFDLTRTEQVTPTPSPTHIAPSASTTAPRADLSVARHAPAPPVTEPEKPRTATSSASELIHMAAESHLARTRGLGKKIGGLLADLSQRLNDEEAEHVARLAAEQEKAKNAKRIAELEAELAKLKGRKAPVRNTSNVGGSYELHCTCDHDECGREFTTLQGLNMHRKRAHDLTALRATDLPKNAA